MSFTGFSDQIDPATMVQNASFWPGINLATFQEEYRLPAEFREKMLIDRIKLAMVWANGELAAWKSEKTAEGAATLEAVPVEDAPEWGSPFVLLYTRAVSCRAKALLLGDYATMLRKSDAQSDALESDETADRWYRLASDAVNEIQGKTSIHAEAL